MFFDSPIKLNELYRAVEIAFAEKLLIFAG
eukprot:SAG31_NODE_964_length_10697_cov_6.821004_2_plen_30_part_00